MVRPLGSRNAQYDLRRRELLVKARVRLGRPGGARVSMRELAEASGVTVPTLRHYFATRQDLVLAVLAESRAEGQAHLAHVAEPDGPFAKSVREVLGYISFGFTRGVGEIHAVGLTEGLREPVLGPGFIDDVLEPSIDAVRSRLDAHVANQEMRTVDTRHAALALLSPVVLVMLHQRELGGSNTHPIDVELFLDEHAEGFVRAYRSTES